MDRRRRARASGEGICTCEAIDATARAHARNIREIRAGRARLASQEGVGVVVWVDEKGCVGGRRIISLLCGAVGKLVCSGKQGEACAVFWGAATETVRASH